MAFKYARLERERRFLLADEPPPAEATRLIEDRYLHGTRLRLRSVAGETSVLKLGKHEVLASGFKRLGLDKRSQDVKGGRGEP